MAYSKTFFGPTMMAFVLLTAIARSTMAGSDSTCRTYAANAVTAYTEANSLHCGFPNSPRWQNNGDNHYRWCSSASDDAIKNEASIRSALILLCQRNSAAVACDQYARRAMEQSADARANGCAIDQSPRWTAPYEGHLAWCVFQAGGLSQSETAARDATLRNCQGAHTGPTQPPSSNAHCAADCQTCYSEGLRCSINLNCQSQFGANAVYQCY